MKIDYSSVSKGIRRKILKMVLDSQTSHLGSCLSCVDILTVLYFKAMKIKPKDLTRGSHDRFILSKGHAAAALYAVLAEKGFFPEQELKNYCADGYKMAGHSTKDCVPGVEVSTGSLGHGLPMGAGMALANKRDKNKRRVFVLMSDGECDEGTVWEAALFASHHKLDNLVAIVDYNKLQAFGRTNEVLNLEPFAKKWSDFGWEAKEVDGHNFSELEKAFMSVPFKKEKPTIVIAHTIKGKGISFIEDRLEWHYKNLTEEDYQSGLKELI